MRFSFGKLAAWAAIVVLGSAMLVVGAFGAMAAQATPGPATGAGPCAYGPATTGGVTATVAGGKITKVDDGYRLTTTTVDDAASWKRTLAVAVPLSTVTKVTYRVTKTDDGTGNAAAAPALRLYLDNGKTLYLEPYYQAGAHLDAAGNVKRNQWFTFDMATAKLWQTGEGGGSYAGNRTLAQFKALYPTATVTAVGVGQGTYNAGTVGEFDSVSYTATAPCVKYVPAPASSSASAAPSASVSARPAGTVQAQLPITGAKPWVAASAGGALLLAGVTALLVGRRSRIETRT
jgi:LPXTG-motif cell wall-anchored protein